jgi:hypothetical protein
LSYAFDQATGLVLYGPSGEVVWSSSRQQAYATDYISDSFTISAMPGVNSVGIIETVTERLKPVSPIATHIMGSFTATQSGGYTVGGVANGGIHQLGGTTLLMSSVYSMYPSGRGFDERYSTWRTGDTNMAGAMLLTTYVESGWFKATIERYKPTAGTSSASWSGLGLGDVTISYQGLAYTFDN